ncbi:MAG: diguanylate cyclase [Alphaproteobacteria bacterium]|nr:diguanylate cyclase [Alphaproteobacteria bacterium]
MLSASVFYSFYNILFGVCAVLLGVGSVLSVRENNNFKSLLLFVCGGFTLIFTTYLPVFDHLLYKIGLSHTYIAFLQALVALATSVLWINAAAELYNGQPANREAVTLYISLGLTTCVYYIFIEPNPEQTDYLNGMFTLVGVTFLLVSSLLYVSENRTLGYAILSFSIFMLFTKILVAIYFFRYNWLNLFVFNWLWIYVFALAVFLIKYGAIKNELQKSWSNIDKLNQQINNMVDLSPFPIIISRLTDNKLLLINNKSVDLFGIGKKDLNYNKLDNFFVDENNRLQFFALLKQNHEVEDFDLMVCNLINSSPFWLSVSAKIIEYNNEMALYMAFQDITLRKERENTLKNQADKDPLTMAWNRRYFEKNVPEYIKKCIKKSQNFALLLIDADKFKNVNDTFGHKTGDRVLIELAEICRNSLRKDDLVARFGGEEFVIFLNNTDTKSAYSVAERLRQNIAETLIKAENDEKINITVSIGVVASEKTASLEILLRQVDDAMYLAKHNGRNQVALYDEEAVKGLKHNRKKSLQRNIHPVFQNEESEEISLLDSYDNKIL